MCRQLNLVIYKTNLINVRIGWIVVVCRIADESHLVVQRSVKRVQDLKSGFSGINIFVQNKVALKQILAKRFFCKMINLYKVYQWMEPTEIKLQAALIIQGGHFLRIFIEYQNRE